MRCWFCFVMAISAGRFLSAQDFSAYEKNTFSQGHSALQYRLLLPAAGLSGKYPLIIFLHGAFEKGDDNEKQLSIGGHFFLRDSIRKNYPAYILFPQCPEDDSWAYFENKIDFTTGFATDWNFPFRKEPTPVISVLKKLIDSLAASGKIAADKIYIAGLSQGGMGVLDMCARYPETFAAAISICGAGEPMSARLFARKVAVWLFHGDKDPVVPVDFARDFYKRLKRLNASVRYSEYKGVEHNCWANAFAEPELMSWLFGQTRK